MSDKMHTSKTCVTEVQADFHNALNMPFAVFIKSVGNLMRKIGLQSSFCPVS